MPIIGQLPPFTKAVAGPASRVARLRPLPEGHDKDRCRNYVYGEVPRQVGAEYNVPQTGCGLCQTKVPCEAMTPPGGRQQKESYND